MPSANSAGSPRNLLTRKPRISAASAASITAPGADQARDHAAAVDVADEHDRHVGGARKPHIGDVVVPQVHFRGAARAFDQHEVGRLLECARSCRARTASGRASCPGKPRPWRSRTPCPARRPARPTSLCGLSSTGFMCTLAGNARGARLQRLGAADLAAILRHRRIVRHVLRLERPHPQVAVGEGARQPGHDQRLADVGARALEHECAGRHRQNSMPACAFTPAAKWCFTSVISVTRSAAAISSGLALRPVTTTCSPGRRAASAATTAARSR